MKLKEEKICFNDMRHGSLFSGIGGFDLAAEWMGWTNVFHCEWNPFGQKVLKYYWPDAKSYGDITKTDFTIHRGDIDILTGGFPCQPYSSAGKRKGTEDARHLWPEMLRTIREIQPRYVVGENVRGLTNWNGGMVFDQVQADLETEGFEVLPFLLPACAINAPHRRDRIWFVAHARLISPGRSTTPLKEVEWRASGKFKRLGNIGDAPNSSNIGQEQPRQAWQRRPGFKDGDFGGDAANSSGIQLQGGLYTNGREQAERYAGSCSTWNGRGNWQDFPTVSPVCSRDDGLSGGLSGIAVSKHRKESIMAYGNAIVPQVAYQIFKAIEQINK